MFYPDKDFINSLSQGERFIFLKILCGMIASDRKVTREELLYLKEMALKYDVSADSLAVMIKNADAETLPIQARMITDRKKALVLIKDLCMIANIDTELADKEIDLIISVADAMGIEGERVEAINSIVNEYLELSEKARILLEQEQFSL